MPNVSMRWTRREFVAAAATLGGGVVAAGLVPGSARGRDAVRRTPLRFSPFSFDLPLPRVLEPVAPFTARTDLVHYLVHEREGLARILPDVETPIWGYEGLYPGPTIKARSGQGILVRFVNELDTETSVHQHGGHTPSDSDGNPYDVFGPGEERDYLYPLQNPDGDPNETPSTMWYHDHTLDLTGPQVYAGLAGLFLVSDDVEDRLVADGVLPGGPFDVPLVLQDRTLNRDGTLFYDPFAHDGFLADLMVVNGVVQPRLRVERRKYRFRILNGANARVFELQLGSGRFTQVGADSWLLPRAVVRDRILLSMAERVDVIVDFAAAPPEVFLFDNLAQTDGRGPDGTSEAPRSRGRVPLVKFEVVGGAVPDDIPGPGPTTVIRENTPIDPGEVVVTRTFEFERSNGAWAVNGRLYDPERIDARPERGTAERWLIVNKSGGWWHPIHMHLEAHQVQRFNGRAPQPWMRGKKDTTLLGPNDEAEAFMKFRTFVGPYVFHCHNVEHEDFRMMGNFEVEPEGTP